MEKGEVAVLSVQFGALVVVVLLLSVFAHGANPQSTPEINTVYWGGPPPTANTTSISEATNMETTNASTIAVFYSLAFSTHVVSISASRLCIAPNQSGLEQVYTSLPIHYDTSKQSYYFTFGPTEQQTGWTCQYTITVTDSLQQTTTWVGAVVVKSASTSTSSSTTSTDK